jgi:hypothetical protein
MPGGGLSAVEQRDRCWDPAKGFTCYPIPISLRSRAERHKGIHRERLVSLPDSEAFPVTPHGNHMILNR